MGNVTAAEQDWFATAFEGNRGRLTAVAYRMLGSRTEADDAVQEAWLRVNRAGAGQVGNVEGWLTTIVARVCLDMLRARKSRREDVLADELGDRRGEPEDEVLLADSVGLAVLVVLETLTPSERIAFVLHDMFDVPFEEIAPVVRRTPAAARQLASRARRKVRGADPDKTPAESRHRQVVEAFLAASRAGDFAALVSLLDPDAVVLADAAAQAIGAEAEVRGAREVAATFAGRARAARAVLIDGAPGLAWSAAGKPKMLFRFRIVEGRIGAIELVADPATLDAADVQPL